MKKLIETIKDWFYPHTMRERSMIMGFLVIPWPILFVLGSLVNSVFYWIAAIYLLLYGVLHLLALRCRHCDSYIGMSYNFKMYHCPYCGKSID